MFVCDYDVAITYHLSIGVSFLRLFRAVGSHLNRGITQRTRILSRSLISFFLRLPCSSLVFIRFTHNKLHLPIITQTRAHTHTQYLETKRLFGARIDNPSQVPAAGFLRDSAYRCVYITCPRYIHTSTTSPVYSNRWSSLASAVACESQLKRISRRSDRYCFGTRGVHFGWLFTVSDDRIYSYGVIR